MTKKEIISAIAIWLVVVAAWFMYEKYSASHTPTPVQSDIASTEPSTTAPSTSPTTVPAAGPAMSATTQAAKFAIAPAPQELPTTAPASLPNDAPIALGSAEKDNANYAMQVLLTPRGASVAAVILNSFSAPDFGHKPDRSVRYEYQGPLPSSVDTLPLATRSIQINDQTVPLWNAPWTRESVDASSVRYSAIINDPSGIPAIKITKTFSLQTREAGKGKSDGYEMTVEQTVQNLSPTQSFKVSTLFNGPTPPPSETEDGNDRMVIAGYASDTSNVEIKQTGQTEFKPDDSRKDLTADTSKQLIWVGQSTGYFAAILLPNPAKPGTSHLAVKAEALDPKADKFREVALTLRTPEADLAAGQSVSLPLSMYLGPKWRKVIANDYYSAFPRKYDETLVTRGGICGWCTFSWLIRGLVLILTGFHFLAFDWGVAIIMLVVLVRVLLHPLTKRSQVQMMKMGKLGPEIEKLKAKYADQPDVLNREMLQIYKQQGGAMLGCLPMFLQTPIWIALWTALQGTFELRQAPFLWGYTWIKDLAKPDNLIPFHTTIHFLFFHISAINILPLLMAVVTFINQKYFMPTPIAATPEQEQQQKMQRGMSMIIPLMFYSFPSGLNLYYLTSMSLGILESKVIRDHIKQQEEIAKLTGPTIVPTKATRASRTTTKSSEAPKGKPTGLMAKFMEAMEQAQKQAEEIRRQKDKGKK